MDIAGILDGVISHALATGLFDGGVNGHEPKSSPGNGLTCAVWAQRVAPVALASGRTTRSTRGWSRRWTSC